MKVGELNCCQIQKGRGGGGEREGEKEEVSDSALVEEDSKGKGGSFQQEVEVVAFTIPEVRIDEEDAS